MIPLTNHDSQWARSELVIIYPEPIYTPQLYSSTLEKLAIFPGNSSSNKLQRAGSTVEVSLQLLPFTSYKSVGTPLKWNDNLIHNHL